MGILNVTADSFSDGGDFLNKDAALRQAEQLRKDGADIIDIEGSRHAWCRQHFRSRGNGSGFAAG